MTFVFIINPIAGSSDCTGLIREKISEAFGDSPESCEVFITQRQGDATEYVRRRCAARCADEEFCFLACGGDGTATEVAQGVLDFDFACMGIVPCGTGNDFVKLYPDRDFLDIAAQREGEMRRVDIISCNGRSAINICNAGLDANVARDITIFKRIPLLGGKMAYIASICKNFFGKLSNTATMVCDGSTGDTRELVLMVVANGRYYGGSFLGAPLAEPDDGKLDLVIVPKVTRPQILSLLPRYQKGRHVHDKDLQRIVEYRKCSSIHIEYETPVTLCLDGETFETNVVDAKVLPGALRLWLPACGERMAAGKAVAADKSVAVSC